MVNFKDTLILQLVFAILFIHIGDSQFANELEDFEPKPHTTEAPETSTTESTTTLEPTDVTIQLPPWDNLISVTASGEPEVTSPVVDLLLPTTQEPERNYKSEILRVILNPDNYDRFVRPPGANGTGPVIVLVSMILRNVENIDDVQMDYSAQLTFRAEWLDSRLSYAHIHKMQYVQLSTYSSIWVPDVFFSNEKSGSMHELMVPNFFGRIFPDGNVLTSYRITMLLSCPMDLHYYPMDKQDCYIRMTSYGYTSRDIVLQWPESVSTRIFKFNMPRFKLTNHFLEECQSVTKTGNYSCIQLRLRFERQFGYYLIQIYAPCFMLVLVSWIGFWLEPTATEARISLAITAVLTVVTQTDGINQSVPPASYIKAVDVWSFMIQFMVFGAVLQFSYVNYLSKYAWARMARRLNIVDQDEWSKVGGELKRQAEKKAKRVDDLSKILFPLIFLFFNVVYWSVYLNENK